MKTKLFVRILWALLFATTQPASATHIVGGELYYRYLGNNDYEIRLTVYRDCYNGIPPFDDPAYVGVWDSANNLIMEVAMSPNDSATVPSTINSPCFQPPGGICVRVANYYAIVNLPPIPGGYQLAYQRCCRNQTILNVVNPLNTGASFYATIPGNGIINSNPVFNELPPAFACNGYPLVFDHSATDLDGDSLVYSICNPLDGANQGNSAPLPSTAPPPFLPISFQAPFNIANLMGGSPLTIDPATGELTAIPNTLGQFVIGICVSEYRNGQLLSTTMRDYQINVVDCPSLVVAGIISPGVVCGSNTVQMTNNSYGASSYLWNFYDPSVPNSTSTAFSPSWTYPDTGTYVVSLIAFSTLDSSCTDTTARLVTFLPEFITDFTIDTTVCSYTVSFNDTSNTGAGTINFWDWNFGDNSAHAYTSDPQHTYAGPGTYTVTLKTRSTGFCRDTIVKTFTLDPPITFQPIMAGPTSACQGTAPPNLAVNIATSSGQSLSPYQVNYTINGNAQAPLFTNTNQVTIQPNTSTVGSQLIQITGITSFSQPDCGSSGTTNFLFTVNSGVSATSSANMAVCQNQPATVDFTGSGGTPPYSFVYNINNGPDLVVNSPAGSSTATIPVNTSIAGAYTFNLTNVAGSGTQPCPPTSVSSTVVTVTAPPNASISIDTTIVCQYGNSPTITFTGTGGTPPYAFQYTLNGVAAPTLFSASTSNTAQLQLPTSNPGTFNVVLNTVSSAAAGNCSRNLSQNALFAVIPAPNATVTGDAVVCQNDAPVNLTFSGSNSTPPYLFEYSINNGTSQTIQSTGTTASINIPTNIAGNFNVLLTGVSGNTNPVCPSNLNDTAIVTVRQLPSATIFTPDSLCLNDNNGVAIVTCSNGVAPYIIDYNLGNGPTLQESTNSNTLSISLPTTIPGQNTVNLLNVTDGGSPSCSRNLSTNGSYYVEEVGPNFMAAPLVCPYSGNYQFLNQTLNGQSWYWDFDDGSYSFETNPFHEFVEGGIFEVTLVATSQSGCVDSISENLEVIQPYRVWIPNAFTPNGDVKNERFMPVITSVQDYSLSIYNRWGQLLFYTDDPDGGWNGQYNGRDLPEGIYVFMITSTDLCNKQDVRRGAFTLAR